MNNDQASDETSRNTTYNETLVTSATVVSCSTPTEPHSAASTTTSGTTVVSATSQHPRFNDNTVTTTTGCSAASPGTSLAPSTSSPSTACMPTNRSSDAVHAGNERKKTVGLPIVPPKPTVRARSTGTACPRRQPRPPNELQASTAATGTNEHSTLLPRVHALEKVITVVVHLSSRLLASKCSCKSIYHYKFITAVVANPGVDELMGVCD